jgi:hypothetical protein
LTSFLLPSQDIVDNKGLTSRFFRELRTQAREKMPTFDQSSRENDLSSRRLLCDCSPSGGGRALAAAASLSTATSGAPLVATRPRRLPSPYITLTAAPPSTACRRACRPACFFCVGPLRACVGFRAAAVRTLSRPTLNAQHTTTPTTNSPNKPTPLRLDPRYSRLDPSSWVRGGNALLS